MAKRRVNVTGIIEDSARDVYDKIRKRRKP